jgi:hypothetical protein
MFKDLIANGNNMTNFAKVFAIFVLLVILNTILIQYLWNKSLVKHISVFKPVSGFKEALLLAIAVNLIRG